MRNLIFHKHRNKGRQRGVQVKSPLEMLHGDPIAVQ